MRACFLEPDFCRDYFIDGWYVPATGEAARRYYSARQCERIGVPKVASGILPTLWSAFGKFFDLSDWKLVSNFLPIFPTNFIPRPDNKHLLWSSKETLEKFEFSLPDLWPSLLREEPTSFDKTSNYFFGPTIGG
jgi:hypothetical protein